MRRVASALVLGSVVLLATWVASPAAPPPKRAPVSATDLAAFDQSAPVRALVDAQVERLRERLQKPPEAPAPSRDPFRFGVKPEPPKPRPMPRVVVAPPAEPVVNVPALPRLVALMATATDGGLLRTAVLATEDDVQVVKPGDAFGRYVVRSLSGTSAELVDPVSGQTYRISLH